MLLDTHALIWAMLAPDLLSEKARSALISASVRCVSAVSLYEITLKASLGKWPEVEHLLSLDLDEKLRSIDFEIIPASGGIMQRAGSFEWLHRDPFDRIIVATAIDRDMAVISKDRTLDTIGWKGWHRLW